MYSIALRYKNDQPFTMAKSHEQPDSSSCWRLCTAISRQEYCLSVHLESRRHESPFAKRANGMRWQVFGLRGDVAHLSCAFTAYSDGFPDFYPVPGGRVEYSITVSPSFPHTAARQFWIFTRFPLSTSVWIQSILVVNQSKSQYIVMICRLQYHILFLSVLVAFI